MQNAYGPEGIEAAALLVGAVTVPTTSSRSSLFPQPWGRAWGQPILKGIAKNPQFIAILSVLPFGLLDINLPLLAINIGNYFANLMRDENKVPSMKIEFHPTF